MKQCKKCGVEKPLTEFFAEKRSADKHRYSCKDCDTQRRKDYWASLPDLKKSRKKWRASRILTDRDYGLKYRLKHRAKDLIRHAKLRAAKKSLPFDLHHHVKEIQSRIDRGFCELTGIPFNLESGRTFDSPSLDRIDPSAGYIYSNLRVVCHLMNCALGDWGEATLEKVVKAWKKHKR